MCKRGDTVGVTVKIPAGLSSTGRSKWKVAEIDSCIVPIVQALQLHNIDMRDSCCGHGEADGWIDLQDGRKLVIKTTKEYKPTTNGCPFCYGLGVWPDGTRVPIGPMDVKDGFHTAACSHCGANVSPKEGES
jgi:hypothetical protein